MPPCLKSNSIMFRYSTKKSCFYHQMHNTFNISAYLSYYNATYVQYRIYKTFSALGKWCSKWRIKLNAKKTQLIVLKKNGRQHKKNKFQLFGEEIDHVEEATLLGVNITKTLTSDQIIKMAISRANKRLNLPRLSWGCKPKIIMQSDQF